LVRREVGVILSEERGGCGLVILEVDVVLGEDRVGVVFGEERGGCGPW